jgi:hypothetical protein
MKVSQMIKNLQDFKKKHGDLDCWYAVDDEGNNYHEVCWAPSLYYVDDDCNVYSNMEDVYDCDLEPEDVREICIVN